MLYARKHSVLRPNVRWRTQQQIAPCSSAAPTSSCRSSALSSLPPSRARRTARDCAAQQSGASRRRCVRARAAPAGVCAWRPGMRGRRQRTDAYLPPTMRAHPSAERARYVPQGSGRGQTSPAGAQTCVHQEGAHVLHARMQHARCVPSAETARCKPMLGTSMPVHDAAQASELTSTASSAAPVALPPAAVSFAGLASEPPRARRFPAAAPGTTSEVCDALRERPLGAATAPSSSRTRLRGMGGRSHGPGPMSLLEAGAGEHRLGIGEHRLLLDLRAAARQPLLLHVVLHSAPTCMRYLYPHYNKGGSSITREHR